MKVLVINAGSSSLKYQVIDMDGEKIIAKGLCERIGVAGSIGHIEHKPQNGKPVYDNEVEFPTHSEAIKAVLDVLVSPAHGVVDSLSEISAVGHRVLHGGMKFTQSVLVNNEVKDTIRSYIPLGPLHNPANLKGIESCEAVMPGVPQVAVFDTAFHQTMPEEAYIYPIPYEYFEKHGIRRYGFHGTSHRYVSAEAVRLLGGKAGSRVVTCHLGNGSSLAAVLDGKCVDTSMGLTPLEGVPMGTRSGNLDPAIIEFLANNEGLTAQQSVNVLNKESGVLGISGVSSDFRDLEEAAGQGNHRAQLALDIFHRSVSKTVASYFAVLGGADAIVFTAGVGENAPGTRAEIVAPLACFGITIDPEKNAVRGTVDITGADSKTKVFVIPTNEELVIARDTKEIAEKIL
ncbi:MAG: acetate kinase [Oscillospiraceae bacterium]|jgi:acetate kinase|nr:acetate kinase [Oscillospiraceae bacterium]